MIKNTLETIKHNKIWAIVIIVLSIVSFWIALNTFTNAMALYTQIDMVKEVLKEDELDNIYTMKVNHTSENGAKVITDLKNFTASLDNTEVGAFYETDEFFEELSQNNNYININKNLYKGTYREQNPESSEIIYIDKEILDIQNTKLTKSMFEKDNSGYLPIYVGKDYKNVIGVGSILTMSRTNQKYIVKGYLEDEKWLNNDDFITFAPISLNAKFMIPFSKEDTNDIMTQESTNGKIFIYFKNKNNIDSNIKKIENYAISNNIKVQLNSVSNLIDNWKEMNEEIIKENIFLTVMVTICSITSIISSMSVIVLLRKQEYGIKIAFGFTKRKLICSLILEIATMEFLAAIITFSVLYLKTLSNKSIFNEVFLRTLGSTSIGYLVIMSVVVCVIVLILPLIIVNHYVPSELIKGGE